MRKAFPAGTKIFIYLGFIDANWLNTQGKAAISSGFALPLLLPFHFLSLSPLSFSILYFLAHLHIPLLKWNNVFIRVHQAKLSLKLKKTSITISITSICI